ncbi:MAG: hypothetical protein ACYS9X_22110 [Planctomycetota bacterium]|jgi:hypothetical protein
MNMGVRGRHAALVLPVALAASLPASALARGERDETLLRAREGLSLSRRDREIGGELLREWRGSEEVAPGTGDPSLGRALESMARGRSLAPDEAGALRRYETSCRRERLEAAERGFFPGTGDRPPGAVGGAAPRTSRVGRGLAAWWFVPAAGAAVVVLGAAWMLAARARRGR